MYSQHDFTYKCIAVYSYAGLCSSYTLIIHVIICAELSVLLMHACHCNSKVCGTACTSCICVHSIAIASFGSPPTSTHIRPLTAVCYGESLGSRIYTYCIQGQINVPPFPLPILKHLRTQKGGGAATHRFLPTSRL